MHPNVEVFRNNAPAARTRLAGVAGIDRHHFDPGLSSLVVEQFAERPQANVVSGQRETTTAEHKAERQVLQHNPSVVVHETPSDLMPEVLTLIPDTLMQSSQPTDCLPSVAPSSPLSGNRPLQDSELAQGGSQMPWAVHAGPIRERQGMRDAHVYADWWVGVDRRLNIRHHNLQAYVPAGRLPNNDDVLEVAFWEYPMPPNTHRSDVLDVEPPVLEGGSIAGFEGHAVEERETPETRTATLTLDELPVGTIQAAEDLLPGAHIQKTERVIVRLLVAPISPHPCLLRVSNTTTAFGPAFATVGESVIVERTGGIEDVPQGRLVNLVWVDPVTIGANHLLPPLLGFDISLDRGRRDIPSRTDEVGTRPHIRQTGPEFWELFAQFVSRETLEPVHDLVGRKRGWEGAEEVNVVGLDREVENVPAQVSSLLPDKLPEASGNPTDQYGPSVLRYPDEVIRDAVGGMPCSIGVHKQVIPGKEAGANPPPG